jgi:hypothetical protein
LVTFEINCLLSSKIGSFFKNEIVLVFVISFAVQLFYLETFREHTWGMLWGGHGLPKVLLGPAMPDPPTPFGLATTEMAFQPFQRLPTHRAGGLWPSFTPLDTPRRTPMTQNLATEHKSWKRLKNKIILVYRMKKSNPNTS